MTVRQIIGILQNYHNQDAHLVIEQKGAGFCMNIEKIDFQTIDRQYVIIRPGNEMHSVADKQNKTRHYKNLKAIMQ